MNKFKKDEKIQEFIIKFGFDIDYINELYLKDKRNWVEILK